MLPQKKESNVHQKLTDGLSHRIDPTTPVTCRQADADGARGINTLARPGTLIHAGSVIRKARYWLLASILLRFLFSSFQVRGRLRPRGTTPRLD